MARLDELAEMADLSHRIEARAVQLAQHPRVGADPTAELVELAGGDAVATALALAYAFRHRDRAPGDASLCVATRLLARALDGVRALAC